jgi:hypothetical protein
LEPGSSRNTEKVSEKHVLIWTTRRYILEEALSESRLGEAVATFPRVHEVVVDVGALSEIQKAELLYNHAKASCLSPEYRQLIRKAARSIINHPNFTPERIRQLTEVILLSPELGGDHRVLKWNDVETFMNNPGERWIKAYKKLSLAEQTLLSAMLDSDGPVDASSLKRSYERRFAGSGTITLTYDQCVTRLKHSFLREVKTFESEEVIALQHPSLRDMLLLQLRQDPSARIRFFALANPFGLASVIAGISTAQQNEPEPQHAVIPKDDEEFAVFLSRVRQLPSFVPQVREWEQLFSAAERLIPRKPRKVMSFQEKLDKVLQGQVSVTSRLIEPGALNIQDFGRTWPGRIIGDLLLSFASRETYEVSQRYSYDAWVRLISHFFRLTQYLSPPVFPAYTLDLCKTLKGSSVDALRLANLLRDFEPIIVRQSISTSLIECWSETVSREAHLLITKGESIDEDSDPDDYDRWHAEASKVLSAAHVFYTWSGVHEIEELSELKELLGAVDRPNEPEGPEPDEETYVGLGDFWTVERIFEDL